MKIKTTNLHQNKKKNITNKHIYEKKKNFKKNWKKKKMMRIFRNKYYFVKNA